MENQMFCYQCQEAAKGTGCVLRGVCGKDSHTSKAMDLLLFAVRGVSVVADALRGNKQEVNEDVNPTFTLKTIFHKFILVLHSPLIFNSLRNRHSSF